MRKFNEYLVIGFWVCAMLTIFIDHSIAMLLSAYPAGYGAGTAIYTIFKK